MSKRAFTFAEIHTNGLHLLIAALRSCHTVMRRGVFDSQDQRFHPLYAFDNPMYSKVLVAWRSEHRKWIRNAGAPDYAGIRSASRADQARQPVGFFQVKRQPLEPAVARDLEPTRLAILAGVRYMIDHAPAREAVVLRMLLESGARVSEVLGLTARGLRLAHNPNIGIDVAALVRNKGEHTARKPIWCSAETREQLLRYIARQRSQVDTHGRTQLEQLGDDDPIFLSRRKRQLESRRSSSAMAPFLFGRVDETGARLGDNQSQRIDAVPDLVGNPFPTARDVPRSGRCARSPHRRRHHHRCPESVGLLDSTSAKVGRVARRSRRVG